MRRIQRRDQALEEPVMTLAQHSAAHDISVARAMRDRIDDTENTLGGIVETPDDDP